MEQSTLSVFDKLQADIAVKLAPSLKITVTDDDSKNNALAEIKTIRGYAKLVEQKRTELVKPLRDSVNEINDYAKKLLKPINDADLHIKNHLLSYEKKLQKIRDEELKRIAEERNKKEAELRAEIEAKKQEQSFAAMFDEPEVAQKKQVELDVQEARRLHEIERDNSKETKFANSMKVSGVRNVWKMKVTDESKVPRQYMVVDAKKVMDAFRESQNNLQIDGIEFFQEQTLAVR